MRRAAWMAPVAALGLVAGCGDGSPAESPSASASSAASASAHEGQPDFTVQYFPNGTRELSLDDHIEGPYTLHFPDILQFCIDTNSMASETWTGYNYGGGAITSTPEPAACADLRITPEDNLAIPRG